MDGLECSEICLSEINVDNEKYRLDSEFFQKKYVSAYRQVKKIPHSTIREELEVLTDFHANGSYESIAAVFKLLDTPDYAYMVRTTDLEKRNYVHDVKYVSKRTYDFLGKSKVYGGEVIINKIGSPGRTFSMPHLNRPVSLGMNQFMLRMKDHGKIDNTLLFVYLNSSIGKLLIERKINGTVPLTIDKEAIRSIYVPCFSQNFSAHISSMIRQSDDLFFQSDSLFFEAHNALMMKLNFDQTQISTKGIVEKRLSESFGISGRLDSEYYQPKYDELCASLHTNDTVRSLCVLHDQNFMPNEKRKYTYIELADVGQMGEISGADLVFGADLPTRARRKVEAGQVIISSIEGSLQSCALITDEFNGALCSTGFYILTSESLNPETLLVLFKSEPIQMLMRQRFSGTILTAISKDELLSMPLPKIDDEVQEVIAEKVQESFSLRRQSKQLLENAKHAVEVAIEQGEDEAMRWLQGQSEI